jgi:hypothetical protein
MNEEKLQVEIDLLRKEIDIQKIDRISKLSKIASLLIIPILFILFIYGAFRLNNLYREIQTVTAKKQSEQLKFETLQFENKALEKKKLQLEMELMSTYGLSMDSIKTLSTTKILENSLLANTAIKSIIHTYTPNNDVTIRYYKKTIDEKRIAIELEALGYKFEERPPAEYMSRRETNAIWYGADVPIEDTKIVVLSLLRAGIPIKGIRPFRSSVTDKNYKRNIIEVGASVDLQAKNVLTVDYVKTEKEFKR